MQQSVWRIVSSSYADRAFDGEGARRYGGRWNHPGTAVVYTSGTLSLAALETFVHADADLASVDMVAISVELPSSLAISTIEVADLPDGWRAYPAPEALQDMGNAWARAAESAVLAVPSAVISEEQNFILNPAHPDFAHFRFGDPRPFVLDPRMWKSR